jgi:hypothetical protein
VLRHHRLIGDNEEAVVKFAAAIIISLILPLTSHAQDGGNWKRVTKAQSQLMLHLPYLEAATMEYQFLDWNARASSKASYVTALTPSAVYPRAQVYLREYGPQSGPPENIRVTDRWLRDTFPFFKNRDIKITARPVNSSKYIRYARFTSERAGCVMFDMRNLRSSAGETNEGVQGVYCAPHNVELTETLIQQVTEGVYVRRGGRIERAVHGTGKPIPPQLSLSAH